MQEKLIQAICDYKGINSSEVSAKSNLICDVGLSSMELFEIVCGFEDEIDFDGIDIEMFNCETVGELAEILEQINS